MITVTHLPYLSNSNLPLNIVGLAKTKITKRSFYFLHMQKIKTAAQQFDDDAVVGHKGPLTAFRESLDQGLFVMLWT